MAKHLQYYFEGINNSVSPFLMKDGDVLLMLNGIHPQIGVVEKRGGVIYAGNQTGTGDILGVHGAVTGIPDGGGFKKYLYQISTVAAVTAVRYLNSGTWTALTGAGTGLTGAESFEMETFLNYTFVVSPSNAPRTIDGSNGTTVSTTTLLRGAPTRATHLASWYNKMYFANCTIGSGVYTSRVYFSSIPFGIVTVVKGDQVGVTTSITVADNRYFHVGETIDIYRAGTGTSVTTSANITAKTGRDEITVGASLGAVTLYAGDEVWLSGTRQSDYRIVWDTNLDWFAVADNDGEAINHVQAFSSQLLIFKPSSVWAYNESSLRSISGAGIGAISGKSVAVGSQMCIFLAKDGFYGVYSNAVQKISSKIDQLLKGVTDANKQAAVGWHEGGFYYCSVPALNILNNDGSIKRTLTNVVFVYNIQQTNWTLLSGIPVKNATVYQLSTNQYGYLGSTNGRVLQAFTGLQDQTGDATYQGIPFELETRDFYFAEPDRFLQYQELYPLSNMLNSMKVMYSVENEAYEELMKTGNLERLLFKDDVYGRYVRFKFTHNDKTACRLYGFSVKYEEKEPLFKN